MRRLTLNEHTRQASGEEERVNHAYLSPYILSNFPSITLFLDSIYRTNTMEINPHLVNKIAE
jgi:hypothetical protein